MLYRTCGIALFTLLALTCLTELGCSAYRLKRKADDAQLNRVLKQRQN